MRRQVRVWYDERISCFAGARSRKDERGSVRRILSAFASELLEPEKVARQALRAYAMNFI